MFHDDADRNVYLELLGKCAKRFDWTVSGYALTSNKAHHVVELTSSTLSKGIQWLNGVYGRRFNDRYARVGHFYDARFRAILVERDVYFLKVLRDVVMEPVREGLVTRAGDYAWTSHRAISGETVAPEWLAVPNVLAQFGSPIESARARYRRFVDETTPDQSPIWEQAVGDIYLGTDRWMNEVRAHINRRPRSDEYPLRQRVFKDIEMTDVIAGVADAMSLDQDRVARGLPRRVASWIGSREALLPHREIAAALGLRSVGYVSTLIQRCEKEMDGSPLLVRTIDACISTIRSKKQQSQV
jgi:putative transposase